MLNANLLIAGSPSVEVSLCLAVANGDKSAETELCKRLSEVAKKEAQRWVRDSTEAEDVAQEALLSMLIRLRSAEIKHPQYLKSYLAKTARYISFSYLRKHARSRTDSLGESQEFLKDDSDGVLEQIEKHNLDKEVENLINKLSTTRDKELLREHYLLEKPKLELCEKLNLTPENFDRVSYRARQHLRKLYERECEVLFA